MIPLFDVPSCLNSWVLPPRSNTFVLILLLGLLGVPSSPRACAEPVDFQRDVGPLLERRCLSCHNDRDRRGGLSLRSAAAALAGGDSGEVMIPGDPQSSYLLELVVPSGETAEMPKGEPPLKPDEVAILRKWIAGGATWPSDLYLTPPTAWSLANLERPPVPPLNEATSEFALRNPIDRFVAVGHRVAKIQPAPPADRRTLIRRLYLDLLGLPPSPAAVTAFVESNESQAYEHLVDSLLASPHFGERWGRHWLDLARYADSEGYLGDSMRPHAWVFRQWVIDAINRDLPFDAFSIQQLAGDLLDEPTLDQRIATGFHRNTLRNTEAGVDLELYRTKEIIDRVNTTGMVWLGLTLGCAECHDHKHDPIKQQDFYQLYAFFNNADEVGVNATMPWEIAEHDRAMQRWQPAWDILVHDLTSFQIAGLTPDQKSEIAEVLNAKTPPASPLKDLEKYFRTQDEGWSDLQTSIEVHLKQRPVAPATKARAFAERRRERRKTFVHIRGVYTRHGAKVSPGTPAALPPLVARGPLADRLDLARWLFEENNPLTARVAANRIWQHLLGEGLVATPNDFGVKGAQPTHPELLDWLATEYRRLGWSRKALIRLIVTSSTYRLSSSLTAVPGQESLSNQTLWRQNSSRVTAETVRDIHLAASGLLDRTIGRRGIRPPLPAFVTEVGRSVKWPVSQGGDRYRRGMYIIFKRTVPYPMLMAFDAPDSTVSCSRRERSNTPVQALTLLNDPEFYECARVLGQEMLRQHPHDVPTAIEATFLRCLARSPSDQERQYLIAAYDDLLALSAAGQNRSDEAVHSPTAAMTAVVRIIMNLDEFITRD